MTIFIYSYGAFYGDIRIFLRLFFTLSILCMGCVNAILMKHYIVQNPRCSCLNTCSDAHIEVLTSNYTVISMHMHNLHYVAIGKESKYR